jgi:hypothetical protein
LVNSQYIYALHMIFFFFWHAVKSTPCSEYTVGNTIGKYQIEKIVGRGFPSFYEITCVWFEIVYRFVWCDLHGNG